MKYLRREKNSLRAIETSEDAIAVEIRKAENYSDEDILEKMKFILFTAPNDELKSIREEAHCVGKEEIARKIFGVNYRAGDSVRKQLMEHIQKTLNPFWQKGLITYAEATDTYILDISQIKMSFLQLVIKEQLFEYFSNLEDPDCEKGQIDMYYDEAQVAFGTAIYKEIRSVDEINGKLLNEFEDMTGESFDTMFVALDPLANVLKQCV